MLPMFLAAVDQTIVATALPAIVASTGEVERASWVVVSYLIASTVAAPIYGRLGDQYGRRRLMIVGLCVFMAASLLVRAVHQHRGAHGGPGAAGARRRRPDDLVAGAGRRGHSAARAGALPGLSGGRRGFRQCVRAGGRRLHGAASGLALDLPDQPAARPRRRGADLAAAVASASDRPLADRRLGHFAVCRPGRHRSSWRWSGRSISISRRCRPCSAWWRWRWSRWCC